VLPCRSNLAFVTFVTTASSNAVNLTDGLDGLAAGPPSIRGRGVRDLLLSVSAASTPRATSACSISRRGRAHDFLRRAHRRFARVSLVQRGIRPQVFMGDTGALAIGGALGTIAILLKTEFLLLIAGAVFAAETLSVLIQTTTYKVRKRRYEKNTADAHKVFRMAPLHHHFEKTRLGRAAGVMRFYILGVLSAMIALATLKVR